MLLALKKSLIIIRVPTIHLEHKLQVQAKFLDLIIKLLIDNSKQLSLVMIDEVLFRQGKLRSGLKNGLIIRQNMVLVITYQMMQLVSSLTTLQKLF